MSSLFRLIAVTALVLVLLFTLSEAIPVETNVRVINALSPGLNLTVHCKSKDDDLGEHILHFQEFYGWHFRPNIWGTTLFYCFLKCQYGSGSFNIFVDHRDVQLCGSKCDWLVKPQGPCLQSYKPDQEFCMQWQSTGLLELEDLAPLGSGMHSAGPNAPVDLTKSHHV